MSLHLVQWVGGKGKQLGDLLPLIPYDRVYVEPYGGGASVLLNRDPSPVEVFNDANQDLCNLFRVVREDPERFATIVGWTLYAQHDFNQACDLLRSDEADRLMRAWAYFVVLNQGISGKGKLTPGNWARSLADSSCADRWAGIQARLETVRARLASVQIAGGDALDCIRYWDSPDAVIYCDPPYVLNTRVELYYGDNDQPDEHHHALVDTLLACRGAVVLSGYPSAIYDPLIEAGWHVTKYGASASMRVNAVKKPRRVEVVYRNPKAVAGGARVPLF